MFTWSRRFFNHKEGIRHMIKYIKADFNLEKNKDYYTLKNDKFPDQNIELTCTIDEPVELVVEITSNQYDTRIKDIWEVKKMMRYIKAIPKSKILEDALCGQQTALLLRNLI